MLKKTLKLLIIITIAFTAGFLFNSSWNNNLYKNRGGFAKNKQRISRPLAYKPDLSNEADDEIKKSYSIIISEYIKYLRNNPEVKFNDFISIRRNKLVQSGEYTSADPKIEEKVVSLYNRINRTGDPDIYDLNSYQIFGNLLPPEGLSSLCDMGDKSSLNISVSVYLDPPSKEYEPVIPYGSILPEPPIDQTFVECETGIFELGFILANKVGEEAPPVYIIATAWESSSISNNLLLAKGVDKKTYGLPPSIVAKRKTNDPVTIRMIKSEKHSNESTINIKTKKDALISLYGLDSIVNLMPDLKVFRTTVAGPNDWANLKAVPTGSSLYINVNSNEVDPLQFILPILSETMDLDIQRYLGDASVIIIPPSNIKYGNVLLFSKTGENKSQHSFSFDNRRPIRIKRMSPVETFLELRSDGKSLGLMPLDILPSTTSIFEPRPKTINIMKGNIQTINSIKDRKNTPCNNCTIRIKYTDKISNTDVNGNFITDDINIIDNKAEIDIETGELSLSYQTNLNRNMDLSTILLKIPSMPLLNSWTKLSPSLPGNSSIYGDYNHHSFRAFIVGINNKVSREATYFDERTGLPNKKAYSTSFEPDKISYGKFVFMDVPSGNYVLYLLTDSKIIDSRIIKVKTDIVTIIN